VLSNVSAIERMWAIAKAIRVREAEQAKQQSVNVAASLEAESTRPAHATAHSSGKSV
jgi:hypothetical protein